MTENRIIPTTVANAETDARLAPVAQASPTGTPLVPARFVPYLMALVGLTGIPAALVASGVALPAAVVAISSAIGLVALVLLGGSPGLRKAP